MSENTVIENSSHSLISYMISTVNFFSFQDKRTRDDSNGIQDGVRNSPVLHNGKMLKRHNHNLRASKRLPKRQEEKQPKLPISRITQGANMSESLKNFSIVVALLTKKPDWRLFVDVALLFDTVEVLLLFNMMSWTRVGIAIYWASLLYEF